MLKLVKKPLEERNTYEGMVMKKFIEMEIADNSLIAKLQFRTDAESATTQELIDINLLNHKHGTSILINPKRSDTKTPFVGALEIILSPLEIKKLAELLKTN